MVKQRIVPAFIISGSELWHTKKFECSKYLGDPLNTVKIFSDKSIPENLILDKSAGVNGIDFKLVRALSEVCSTPLCYGGGIKSLQDIEKIISCGVERVLLNTCIHEDSGIYAKAIREFGSSSIAVCLETKRDGSKILSSFQMALIDEMNERPPSEIILVDTYINGTRMGLRGRQFEDILLKLGNNNIGIMGGCKSYEDAVNCLMLGFSAVYASTIFSLYGNYDAVMPSYFGD